MQNNNTIQQVAILGLLALGLGATTVHAQQSKGRQPTDIENIDPFIKGEGGVSSKPEPEPSAEMLDAQARILFYRGEITKAQDMQLQAVNKARGDVAKFSNTLKIYMSKQVVRIVTQIPREMEVPELPGETILPHRNMRKQVTRVVTPIPREMEVPEMAGEVILFEKKLQSIIIPSLDFQHTTLDEAITFLNVTCRALDTLETDPSKKGIRIEIQKNRAAPSSGPSPDPGPAPSPFIEKLSLKNVPLETALKHICDATKFTYTKNIEGITLEPAKP